MNATHSTEAQLLLFLVIIVWRLARKLREQPIATDRQRWRLPLILTAIGGYETLALTRGAHPLTLTTADVAYLAVVGGLSVLLGLLRGATIRIRDHGGALTQQYTPLTAGLWLATIALRLGADLTAAHSLGVAAAVTGTSILMMFGLSLLGESLCVALRTGASPAAVRGLGPGPARGSGRARG